MGAIQQVLLGSSAAVNNYATLVLASSPYVYWRLNQTSGTSATDSSGNGRHGVYTRDASNTTTPGLLNNSTDTAYLGPAATSSPVSGITWGSAADPGNNFTATVIIRPSGVPPVSGAGGVMQLGANGLGCPQVVCVDQGSGMFKLLVERSGVATIITSSSSWAYGTKLHVKLSRNTGNAINLRVNGVSEGSATNAFPSATTITRVGQMNPGGGVSFQFAGVIDEFVLWNSFISDTTTDAQYAAI